MASLEENLRVWNEAYDWPCAGDEWSADFGGTEALWFFVLYPRLHRFLPATRILEIAPGFGRWTQFLKTQCESMIAVDISEKCVAYCEARYASDRNLKFQVNDGTSLAAVPDNSIDFVFSFDSLVHAEANVIHAYLSELARKLTPEGVGFIHHSNIGAYPRRLKLIHNYFRLPCAFRRKVLSEEQLSALLSINFRAARANSMTAALFREYCQDAGLECLSQETFNWGRGKSLIDAISVFARPGSRWERNASSDLSSMRNGNFVEIARLTSRLAKLYCS
jgi:ubiquinone/menaquinone biosynthesis C-methylase UbiE